MRATSSRDVSRPSGASPRGVLTPVWRVRAHVPPSTDQCGLLRLGVHVGDAGPDEGSVVQKPAADGDRDGQHMQRGEGLADGEGLVIQQQEVCREPRNVSGETCD